VVNQLDDNREFKDSPLGMIPKDWDVVPLKSVANIITKGSTPTTYGYSYTQEGILFLRVENITNDGFIKSNQALYIDKKTNDFLKRSQLKKDDLLVSIAGTIGRIALVNSENIPANINQALAVVRLDNSKISCKFTALPAAMRYILKAESDDRRGVRRKLYCITAGSAVLDGSY
jgi:type I restriction enzyme, S subunit